MSTKYLHEMTPEEASTTMGVSLEDMRSRSELVYLLGNPDRTKAGFRALWRKWETGKANMPLSVSVALKSVTAESEKIMREVMGGLD